MISKKKLKERLLDLANGAGMVWCDDYYFEYENGVLECTGNLIQAIERAFGIPENSRLRAPFRLKEFEDIDTITSLVDEALRCDVDNGID